MLGRRRMVGLGLAALALGALRGDVETLFAQEDGAVGTLTGRVTDSAGAPLAGVTVTLVSASLEAGDLTLITDGDGRFTLAPAPAGLYDVQAQREGFRAGIVGAVPVQAGQSASAVVVLEPRVAGEGGY